MDQSRRSFFQTTAALGAAALSTQFFTACGVGLEDQMIDDGSLEEELASSCSTPTISANHGHSLNVPLSDVNGSVSKTYSIAGSASHDHKVTITAAQFAQLAAGASLQVSSTTDAFHAHDVTVTCLAAAQTCPNGASAVVITANHGHSLTVPKADAAAGKAKKYSIQGAANHPHIVSLTTAHFSTLKKGGTVTVTSTTTGGHSHSVSVKCA